MNEPRRDTRLEVIKHSAAIQIHNNITLLQRRAWNVLLFNAYNALPTEEVHYIPLRELAHILDYDSHDEEYLKDALRALVSCTVEWNILNKDGKVQWGVSGLLASAIIENGMCAYAYSPPLRERLHNPAMYARLDLSLQKQFESKYALALWELCADYLGAAREQGETPFILLGQFRKLLGIPEGTYPVFKKLNQKVLTPAVNEINRVSDFRVTIDHERQGRKVTALKFKIRRVLMLPAAISAQRDLFPDLADMPAAVRVLHEAGLAMQDAFEIWQKGFSCVAEGKRPALGGEDQEQAFTRYVREKIHLLEQRKKQGKANNPTGFLLTALRQNYSNAEFEREEAAKERGGKVKKLKSLLSQKEKMTKEQDEALRRGTDGIIGERPQLADMAIEALKAEKNFVIVHFCREEKTGEEHYRKNRAVADVIGEWLERQFPERYEDIRQPYREKLEGIETRIRALEAEGVRSSAYA